MNDSFNLKAFEKLPATLKPSDYVDFLLFFLREKPCIRLGVNQNSVYQEMAQWCKENRLSYVISHGGLMYISKYKLLAWLANVVDDSMIDHAFLLGKILGYPMCCSKKVASIGERNIDEYEKTLVQNNSFHSPYHIINPQGYLCGYSLISHIPCCANCKKSLKKASKAYKVVEKYKEHPAFQRWASHWFCQYLEDR